MRRLLALLAVLAVGCASAQEQATTTTPADPITTTAPVPLVDLVAQQVEGGDTACPAEGPKIAYEACLLFQGAMYLYGGEISAATVMSAAKDPRFQNLYAIAVVRATPILSSSNNYGFHSRILGDSFEKPGSDPEVCLQVRYGICGNQSSVALGLLEQAGIPSRRVEFYYQDPLTGDRNSHVTVEAWIGGAWRYLDTTYGSYWPEDGNARTVASLDDVLAMDRVRETVFRNDLLAFTYDLSAVNHPAFEYLEVDADILRGGIGVLHLDMSRGESESFQNIPNYVGDNRSDAKTAGIEMLVKVADPTIYVDVRASVGVGSLCADEVCIPLEGGSQVMAFQTDRDEVRLWVESAEDVTYAVLSSLSGGGN